MRHWALLVAVIAAVPACGGASGGGNVPGAAELAPTFPDPGIESFPDAGSTVVPVGTDIQYSTDPPTSGPHYPTPQPGGFTTAPIAPGYLVGSMASGGVVIYYDAAPITAPDLDALHLLAEAHSGDSQQVVVVPRQDPAYPIILTAWTRMLPLGAFDQARIDNFVALFLGKGP